MEKILRILLCFVVSTSVYAHEHGLQAFVDSVECCRHVKLDMHEGRSHLVPHYYLTPDGQLTPEFIQACDRAAKKFLELLLTESAPKTKKTRSRMQHRSSRVPSSRHADSSSENSL